MPVALGGALASTNWSLRRSYSAIEWSMGWRKQWIAQALAAMACHAWAQPSRKRGSSSRRKLRRPPVEVETKLLAGASLQMSV